MEEKLAIRSEENNKVKSDFAREVKESIVKGSLTTQTTNSHTSDPTQVQKKVALPMTTPNQEEQEKKKTEELYQTSIRRRRQKIDKPTSNNNNIMEVAHKQKIEKQVKEVANDEEITRHGVSGRKLLSNGQIKIPKASILKSLDKAYDRLPQTRGIRTLKDIDEKVNHVVRVEDYKGRTFGKIRAENGEDKNTTLDVKKLRPSNTSLDVKNLRPSTYATDKNLKLTSTQVLLEKINDEASTKENTVHMLPSLKNVKPEGGIKGNVNLGPTKVVTTKRLILPDKRKLYTEKKYNRIYNPTTGQKMQSEFIKTTKGGVVGVGKLTFEQQKKVVTNKLKGENGLGGEMAAAIIKSPSQVKMGIRSAKLASDGATGAGKLVWNTSKKVSVNGYKVGYIAKEGIKEGAKEITEYGFKEGMYNNLDKVGSTIAKKTRKMGKYGVKAIKSIPSLPEKAIKKVSQMAKESLKKVITKLLPSIAGAFLVIIIIVLIITMLASGSGKAIEGEVVADNASILATEEYLNGLVDEWDEKMEEIKESFLKVTDCPYGNNDTVEVFIKCDDEDATIKTEYLALYCLLATTYDMEIQNMGVEKGNILKPELVSADVMKQDLEQWFYYLNPINLSEMDIEREKFVCQHDWDEDDEEYDHDHLYHHTKITVTLRTVTELISSLNLTDEQIGIFNTIYGDLLTEGYDPSVSLDWKGGLGGASIFDQMDKEVWIEYWDNEVPVLNITRAEFVEMVKTICIPSGQISYSYGSKDISTGALDCSGFTKVMYMQLGINIGDGTAGQWENSKSITSSEAKPGDLVFKQPPNANGINHVGIYLGNEPEGRFGHCASSSGTIVNSYKGFVFYRRPLCKFKDDVENK